MAIGIVAMLLASVAPLAVLVVEATDRARMAALAAAFANSHLERLKALPWYAQADGTEVIDRVSGIDEDGFLQGGPGLSPGDADTLQSSTAWYADQPAEHVVGIRPGLTRRWRVAPYAPDAGCVVVSVEVARTRALGEGQSMRHAAMGRAQTILCAAGARP